MKLYKSERAALDAALFRLGISCSNRQKELLLQHVLLVIDYNRKINLTGITNIEDAIVVHIEDSLSIYKTFCLYAGRFCDLGTGGGFPGLPIGIVSHEEGVLLDATKKKAWAVQSFIKKLGLEKKLEAQWKRSEELAQEIPESFDIVMARAVAPLNVIEELACPLLKPHGHIIAMRGTESEENEEAALRASESLGLILISKKKTRIGQEKIYKRTIYTFEKIGPTKIKLPRRVGMALKRPLGI